MPSFITIVVSLVFVYLSSLVYRLLVNFNDARKSGFPYFIIPFDQNSFFWMTTSVPLRPWLIRNMPKWIYDRLSLTIYGFEFHEKLRPYEQYAAPQGNDKSYVIVTPGKFELSTRDSEIITEILARPKDFMVVDLTELFMGKFGSNVLTSNGDSWSRQRKIVASVINERISKTVFSESTHQTQGLLDEVLGHTDAGETNRIFDMMKKITINVLSGAGMGTSVEWNDNASEKPSPGFKMTYIEAVKHVIEGVAGPIILPHWFLSNYPSFLPGYQTLKALGYAVVEFPIHTRNLLDQERQRTIAAHGETRSNIMSQLLHASEQGDGELKGIKALSEEEMLGNLFIFTAAGFDTTANTLAYALVLLARYPKWQEWIFEEIDDIIPDDSSADLDYTAIFPKATRVQACMFEVLRLFPPVIHLAKMTKTPQKIQTSRGTFYFPPKTTIYINTVGLHIDPAVWRNLNLAENEEESETDELAFRPSRWINPSTESSPVFKPPKGTYVPWSAGPRVCPGQKMALVEFSAIFLKLFHNHRIEAVPSKTTSGALETKAQLESRLDATMRDSISVLTLQMNGVYDVRDSQDKGLKLRLSKR
ncbi:cytochrome P450 [Tricladium varicosporioides]|nr:cytochrome P450 [Hymenoscyphus varicosporioides]